MVKIDWKEHSSLNAIQVYYELISRLAIGLSNLHVTNACPRCLLAKWFDLILYKRMV